MKQIIWFLLILLVSCRKDSDSVPEDHVQESSKPELLISVKRDPGYRCGQPDTTTEPIYLCAKIDLITAHTEGGQSVWLYHESHFGGARASKSLCEGLNCSNTFRLERDGNYYIVAFDGRPPEDDHDQGIDIALLRAREAGLQMSWRRIEVHY